MMYPLGEDLYAYVKTRKGCVKIHVRHFAEPKDTKGGKVMPTVKGVTMDLKKMNRLFKVKKHITEEFKTQQSVLPSQSTLLKRRQKNLPRLKTLLADERVQKGCDRQSTTYPDCCVDVGALTPHYPAVDPVHVKQMRTDIAAVYPDPRVDAACQIPNYAMSDYVS